MQSQHEISEAAPKLVNRLSQSSSPYVRLPAILSLVFDANERQVRGHMNNPVAWQLWDAESIALARKYNRLIFLSIGYSACHCTFPLSLTALVQL